MADHMIKVNSEKCIGCGMCVKDCPAHNIELKGNKANICTDECIMCGHCEAVCPKEAITISGYATKPVENKGTRLNPEEVLDVIRFRRTVRQFQHKEIPKAVIGQILEAGRLTHTAKNLQDVSFIVLDKKKEKIEQMAVQLFRKVKPLADLFSPMARRNKIDDHFFFFHAPIVIVIAAKDKGNGVLAAQNMEFVAEANGLGVLFSGFFTIAANSSRRIRKTLGIPKGKKAAATLVLGYPKVKYQRSAQRNKPDVKFM